MTSLTKLSVADFISAVGRDQPAPGSGGAAAVALALAGSCARKALVISSRRHGGDPELDAGADRCAVLAQAAATGIDRDAVNFRALLQAAPGADEPCLRLEGDAEVLLALAEELRAIVGALAHAIDADLSGDASAALALIDAFERIERRNLADVSGEAIVELTSRPL